MRNIAVLTIDMQPGSLRELSLKKAETLIENHQKLYLFCKEKRIEIINIEYDSKGDTTPKLIKGRKQEYKKNNFSKQGWSAFTNKKFNDYIEKKGFQGFILTGLYADKCVLTTGKHKENKFAFYNCRELIEFRNPVINKEKKEYLDWASNEKNNNFYYPELQELLEDLENETLPLN